MKNPFLNEKKKKPERSGKPDWKTRHTAKKTDNQLTSTEESESTPRRLNGDHSLESILNRDRTTSPPSRRTWDERFDLETDPGRGHVTANSSDLRERAPSTRMSRRRLRWPWTSWRQTMSRSSRREDERRQSRRSSFQVRRTLIERGGRRRTFALRTRIVVMWPCFTLRLFSFEKASRVLREKIR